MNYTQQEQPLHISTVDLNSTRPQKTITTLPVWTFKEFKEFSFIYDTEEKRTDNTQVRCLLTARATGGGWRA